MLQPVFYTVTDVTFQYDLAAFMQSRFSSVDLGQDVLAGNILLDHFIDGVDLSGYFGQPPVKILKIHALSHIFISLGLLTESDGISHHTVCSLF